MQVFVSRVRSLARDILQLELSRVDGQPLPGAAPGSHIDLALGNGLLRQYSLTNADGASQCASYAIAVAFDPGSSRGGSRYVHERVRVGTVMRISAPRNLFAIDPTRRRLLLIAGGIGITPIYAMSRWAEVNHYEWRLVYASRSENRAAFVEELRLLSGGRVHFHFDDQHGGRCLELRTLIAGAAADEAVYCCGPAGMMEAVKDNTVPGRVKFESFTPARPGAGADRKFRLRLARSSLVTEVGSEESVLEAIERLHIEHPYSCRQGLCGTCEVSVMSGQPDHRDSVLSESERATGRRFLPCVSRSHSDTLEIDI